MKQKQNRKTCKVRNYVTDGVSRL